MAKKAPARTPQPPREPWKKWLRTTDLVEWMHTLLGLTDYMDDLGDRTATVIRIAIDLLASLEEPLDALQWIERLDKTVPADNGHHHSQFVMQAAKIALNAGMMEVMEEYLERMLGMQALFPRKCDQGYAEKRVRDFRSQNGLLAARDAVGDKQRADALFNTLLRSAGQAMDGGDNALARQQLVEALPMVEEFQPWGQIFARLKLIEGFKRAGDEQNLSKLLEFDDHADKDHRLLADQLLRIGQRERAIARYQQQASESLAELETETLNAHFPAMFLKYAIIGLADAGEMTLARDWLGRALKEGAAWNITRIDAFSASVFESMAKAVARVEGNQAALAILDIAAERAENAEQSGWRTAALGSVAELRMQLSPTDKAEATARAVRSPDERRRLLVNLFAKRQDWEKLHETLDTTKTPIEAAQLIYDLKFIWRPQA